MTSRYGLNKKILKELTGIWKETTQVLYKTDVRYFGVVKTIVVRRPGFNLVPREMKSILSIEEHYKNGVDLERDRSDMSSFQGSAPDYDLCSLLSVYKEWVGVGMRYKALSHSAPFVFDFVDMANIFQLRQPGIGASLFPSPSPFCVCVFRTSPVVLSLSQSA